MADVLTLADMPDLSDWRLAPLWTLGLAAPVTGLAAGVGMAGVKQCFDEWLEANGVGKHEDRRIIEQAEDFIDLYALGMRFLTGVIKVPTKTMQAIGNKRERNWNCG